MSAALLATELGRTMDRLAYARIRSAAAEVAGHRAVDIGVRRLRVLLQQRGGGHDLTGLAVPALGYVHLDPRLLHRVAAIARQPFDSRNGFTGNTLRRCDARACRYAIDVHGT